MKPYEQNYYQALRALKEAPEFVYIVQEWQGLFYTLATHKDLESALAHKRQIVAGGGNAIVLCQPRAEVVE